jgi:hypothetical protein
MTPDPKYLAMKNVSFGTCIFLVLASHIGSRAPSQTLLGECVVMEKQMQIDNLPNIEPAPMTKMAEIRIPSRPSYPLGALQSIVMVLGDGNVSAMIVNYVKMTGPSQTRCLASSWKYMQPQDAKMVSALYMLVLQTLSWVRLSRSKIKSNSSSSRLANATLFHLCTTGKRRREVRPKFDVCGKEIWIYCRKKVDEYEAKLR